MLYPFKKERMPVPGTKEVENTRKLKYGPVRINLKNLQQLEKLKDLRELAGLPVKTAPHRSLNSCRWHTSYFAADQKEEPPGTMARYQRNSL